MANKSHPSWVCGLKHSANDYYYRFGKSHPSWVCGLKQQVVMLVVVLPRHTLRGCVD